MTVSMLDLTLTRRPVKPLDRDAIRARMWRDFALGARDRCERTATLLEDLADEIRRGRVNALVLDEASRLLRMRQRIER